MFCIISLQVEILNRKDIVKGNYLQYIYNVFRIWFLLVVRFALQFSYR